jgi:hypothetical protein
LIVRLQWKASACDEIPAVSQGTKKGGVQTDGGKLRIDFGGLLKVRVDLRSLLDRNALLRIHEQS